MKRQLEGLAGAPHDLAIVGGGVYGACAAWEAARRGLRVCLLERGDFGHATSSNSLRVVHGGLRYVQHGDLKRMRDSIRERRILLDMAPHLVRPLPFAIPIYGHGLRGKAAHAVALAIADLVGLGLNASDDPRRQIRRSRVLSRSELLRLCPGLPDAGVSGGALWHDGQVRSTERLLIAFLESASLAGARLANHAEVVAFLREGRCVAGVVVRDHQTGREVEIPARMVLNAAGPWADAALRPLEAAGGRRFLPSKGLNLLTRQVLPDRAVGIPGPARFSDRDAWVDKGSRLFFIVPWRGYSLIGTRHLPFDGPPDQFRVTAEDVRLFLGEINAAYPRAALAERDVLAVYAGMLPRNPGSPAAGEVELLKRSRVIDHEREEGLPGLVTVVGTKWTTARAVAERAVELVAAKLGRNAKTGAASAPRLAGGDVHPFDGWVAMKRATRPAAVSEASMLHVLASYGSSYADVLRLVREEPALAEPLRGGSPVIGAEVVHAARNEMARHLDDVVLRRTEVALGGHPGNAALEACAALAARELGWDPPRIAREMARAQAALVHPLREGSGASSGASPEAALQRSAAVRRAG